MTFTANSVRPGELITADLMNQILAELASLDAQVTALQALVPTGVVAITPLGYVFRNQVTPIPAGGLTVFPGEIVSIWFNVNVQSSLAENFVLTPLLYPQPLFLEPIRFFSVNPHLFDAASLARISPSANAVVGGAAPALQPQSGQPAAAAPSPAPAAAGGLEVAAPAAFNATVWAAGVFNLLGILSLLAPAPAPNGITLPVLVNVSVDSNAGNGVIYYLQLNMSSVRNPSGFTGISTIVQFTVQQN